jgi:hypothetical protein
VTAFDLVGTMVEKHDLRGILRADFRCIAHAIRVD